MTPIWQGRHLYFGKLYVGEVQRLVPERWREWKHVTEPRTGYYADNEAEPWRCWIMLSDEGDELPTRYATEGGAMTALVDAVTAALTTSE